MRKLQAIAHHRNGICGEPFYVLTFTESGRNMIATVFYHPEWGEPPEPRVAVFDRDLLANGEIGFGLNSWRGDHYADWCYSAIRRHVASEEIVP